MRTSRQEDSRLSDQERAGLRYRLTRIAGQIDEQHRHLRLFQESLRRATTPTPSADAALACRRYQRALLDHFELEEGIFFPALHGFDGSTGDVLVELLDEHSWLRSELEQLTELIASQAREAGATLERLLYRLDAHEASEQALWKLIE